MLQRYCARAVGVSLLMGSWSGHAVAQPRADAPAQREVEAFQGYGADYSVTFSDDPLGALVETGTVPRIALRLRGQRTLLLRARTSFVGELLKSVEKM